MKIQLFLSTAAVLFNAFSGSVSASSVRGAGITSDAIDSSDYYPESEDYDSADYYPESDEDLEDPLLAAFNHARRRQQIRRFGHNSGRAGSNRRYNTSDDRIRDGTVRPGNRRVCCSRDWDGRCSRWCNEGAVSSGNRRVCCRRNSNGSCRRWCSEGED